MSKDVGRGREEVSVRKNVPERIKPPIPKPPAKRNIFIYCPVGTASKVLVVNKTAYPMDTEHRQWCERNKVKTVSKIKTGTIKKAVTDYPSIEWLDKQLKGA